ncbi:MAG: type 4a pilus biogenesis protein PilO [Deltaproteobacteria bacterium]|nr:type 4a pilus biogenesis protein PilO [Deltaproteobacteria bacterium]MBW1932144.1 type 4a pilus biogenesis protein PilO [Deltaproteobacteria bacterium]MBW1964739.1 type 4a pilus biogenesis protein PilO [Deltaproteobacteria bacterium]MBW2350810.1 type 4a pilus biogenesis protein PilO [Deltaproteobacteria bacterium]
MKFSKPSLKIPPGLFQSVYALPVWQKAGIWLLVSVIPIALFWFFFLSVRLEEIKTMSEKIPKQRQELVKLEARSKQIPQLEKELNTMKGILQKALKLLPEKEDIPTFLPEISSLGNEARLDFLSFKPQKEQPKAFYAAIPINMEFNGPFHNTVDFFNNVSRMARIVHIKSVSMGKAKQTTKVWSQKGSATSNQKTEATGEASPIKGTGEGLTEGQDVKKGGTWIISTRCDAVTYRFLSPKEQQANKKKKKKKRR